MTVPAHTKVALSLGGNLGDVPANFAEAIRKLEDGGLRDVVLSSLFMTEPVDCPPGMADFINAAATGLWPDSAHDLFSLCKNIEASAGRAPAPGGIVRARPLDIDIILFGGLVFSDEELTVPHRNAAKRLFVLIPLDEIASDLIFPDTGLKVSDLIAPFRNTVEYGKILGNRI